jgi:hypothetical protein
VHAHTHIHTRARACTHTMPGGFRRRVLPAIVGDLHASRSLVEDIAKDRSGPSQHGPPACPRYLAASFRAAPAGIVAPLGFSCCSLLDRLDRPRVLIRVLLSAIRVLISAIRVLIIAIRVLIIAIRVLISAALY